jgi:hypothetical protein
LNRKIVIDLKGEEKNMTMQCRLFREGI